jgi:hypothetical protein
LSSSEDIFFLQRLALHESNISRFHEEFVELCIIGSGQFGSVHKCINRLGLFLLSDAISNFAHLQSFIKVGIYGFIFFTQYWDVI